MPRNDTPRVFVVCLACYNDGTASGEWIDATDADAIREYITETQAKCGHIDSDWAIHDYDGMPSSFGENPDLDKLEEMAKAIEEHGEAFTAYIDMIGEQYATVENFQDAYCGEYDSERAYAEEYIDSTGMLDGVNSSIASYFDYDAFARDLFMDGYTYTSGFVFRDC